ncbi:MAG: NADP-dependent oxidoreductase [Myxococcales bacterium]|nr:NADP-dependent oxidoreductase [Myxococcales bacterium]MCB9565770.1 NADP-dependent oxidoreductase [Myxococcales bacterium]MCB9703042.1 NADP-dependent oxidoreductase [Myxococcales bacterium]
MLSTSRQFLLRSRPKGPLAYDDLELRDAPLGELADGEVRLRSTWMSIDPTIRIWMSDVPQYLPPIAIGEVIRSIGTAVVVASRHPDFAEGDAVFGLLGWQTHPQGTPEALSIQKIAPGVDPTAALSIFGMTAGLTAYHGLVDVVDPKPGETLVVDAAAGTVGGLVGQIGKILGCRVIGIAGGPEKCAYVTDELGFDACIDYRNEDVGAALDRLCPEGIDVCFENVGGPIFDAILLRMKLHGRISLCGMIAGYDAHEPVPGPYNFGMILMRRLMVKGFIILDFVDRFPEAIAKLGGWVAEGRLRNRVHELEGFERLPDALRLLVGGQAPNLGKMVVKIS